MRANKRHTSKELPQPSYFREGKLAFGGRWQWVSHHFSFVHPPILLLFLILSLVFQSNPSSIQDWGFKTLPQWTIDWEEDSKLHDFSSLTNCGSEPQLRAAQRPWPATTIHHSAYAFFAPVKLRARSFHPSEIRSSHRYRRPDEANFKSMEYETVFSPRFVSILCKNLTD